MIKKIILFNALITFIFLNLAFAQSFRPIYDKEGNRIYYHWGKNPWMEEMIQEHIYTIERHKFFNSRRGAAGPGIYFSENPYSSSYYYKSGGSGGKGDGNGALIQVHIPSYIKLKNVKDVCSEWYATEDRKGITFSKFTAEGLENKDYQYISDRLIPECKPYFNKIWSEAMAEKANKKISKSTSVKISPAEIKNWVKNYKTEIISVFKNTTNKLDIYRILFPHHEDLYQYRVEHKETDNYDDYQKYLYRKKTKILRDLFNIYRPIIMKNTKLSAQEIESMELALSSERKISKNATNLKKYIKDRYKYKNWIYFSLTNFSNEHKFKTTSQFINYIENKLPSEFDHIRQTAPQDLPQSKIKQLKKRFIVQYLDQNFLKFQDASQDVLQAIAKQYGFKNYKKYKELRDRVSEYPSSSSSSSSCYN